MKRKYAAMVLAGIMAITLACGYTGAGKDTERNAWINALSIYYKD